MDESCPGCILNNLKQSNSGIPFKHFFYVFVLPLTAALPISSLFPFLYFMIEFIIFIKFPSLYVGHYNGVVNKYFVRAYVSEICHTKYQALGMSIISTAWGIGLVIGPALGGFLSQPAEKFPNIFSKDSLFGRFSYLLPCFTISIFALGVTILCCWMPETLHFHTKNDEENERFISPQDESTNGYDLKEHLEEFEEKCPSLSKNWSLISSIVVYCVFQLHDMAYTEIFPLWAVSPKKYGGLSYSSEEVGEVLAISGFVMLLFQLFLYPPIERNFGPVLLSRVGAVITIVVLSSYPFIAKLSGLTLTILIDLASVLKIVISNQSQRGTANGISMAATSLFKAAGPAGGGALFSWAQNHQNGSFLPGTGSKSR
ncbi:protein ZINC INDUCED FACILITATOR 1-like [Humulus lupulus]|uniref:protein ZINC INDUCED FACILITATOR 1-like n=1 Tax=Humulus lupulus TaxID=3486 RepID=UPI002B411466|nr:protein ZINC INDUCED FACILITATOR 1-like [Humulus lupulus]